MEEKEEIFIFYFTIASLLVKTPDFCEGMPLQLICHAAATYWDYEGTDQNHRFNIITVLVANVNAMMIFGMRCCLVWLFFISDITICNI